MGLLSDIARQKIYEFSQGPFDLIEGIIEQKILIPIEQGVDDIDAIADTINEIEDRILTLREKYEQVQSARQNIRRARKTAEVATKTADTSDKAATIASALDKISAAVSYGLKLLKDRLRSEIDDLKDAEDLFEPAVEDYERRKEDIADLIFDIRQKFERQQEERRLKELEQKRRKDAVNKSRTARLSAQKELDEEIDAEVQKTMDEKNEQRKEDAIQVGKDFYNPFNNEWMDEEMPIFDISNLEEVSPMMS